MTNEQRMGFLMMVVNLIFASKAANSDITTVRIPQQWMPFVSIGGSGRYFKGQLRGFDLTLNLGNGDHIALRILEQNPFKRDNAGNFKPFSVLAQQGHKIAWVINQGAPAGNQFLGRIEDGVWVPSEQRPVQNAGPMYTGPQPVNVPHQAPVYDDSFQEVPPGMDVPEYVVMEMGAEEDFDMPDLEIDESVLAEFADDFDSDLV